jgi:hypothetical protein
VSGIDTLAPSHIARNISGAGKAAADRDKRKLRTYADLEEKLEVRIVPFIDDLLGGLQPAAVDVLKEIAKSGDADDLSHRARMHQVHRCISRMSIAIQRDNAQMLRNAFLNAQL